jgi:nitroreductase
MKFDDIVKERYSVRSYQDRIVEKEVVEKILESGRLAPTAGCENPVTVYILNEEQISKLKEATRYTFGAKNMFLICYDNNISYKREQDGLDFGIQDASIITTHMMLKITELGLGSCWVGSFYEDKVKEVLNLDENMIPVALLPFGYIGENSKPSSWHNDRKTMSEFAKVLDN